MDPELDADGVTDETADLDLELEDPGFEGEFDGGVEGGDPEGEGSDEELFTIKVDGTEEQLPLEELIARAQMGTDYTKKTQALAAEREAAATYKALEQALARDFPGTMAALAEAFGFADQADIDAMDPLEKEVHELRTWRADQERIQRENAVKAELATVKQTFNDPELDEAALLAYAVSRGISNLEDAYKAFSYGKPAAAADAQKQQKVAAKRSAPVVAGGARRPSRTAVPGASDHPSIEEALAMAIKEHGPISF